MNTTNADSLRWGIIGPGLIAGYFSEALANCKDSELVAIATRDPAKDNFSKRFPGARIHEGYDALLQDDEVDVVYIATPHPMHAEWGIKAANAGKHVLCEKPIGISTADAEAMFAAAKNAGTFMGEAFMYRFHPLTAKLIEALQQEIVGKVGFIESSMAFERARDAANRRLFTKELGGGGILDIGVYPVSMTRLVAGVVAGDAFADPSEVKGVAHFGPTGVDEWAAAVLRFPGDIVAQIACGISIQLDNTLRIHGDRGRLEIQDFWFGGGFDGGTAYIEVIPSDGEPYTIAVGDEGRGLYEFEVDATAVAIAAGTQQFSSPGMTWQDSLGNMRTIDEWRRSIGFDDRNGNE